MRTAVLASLSAVALLLLLVSSASASKVAVPENLGATCESCTKKGKKYYCTKNHECYSYEFSCGLGCHDGTCLKTGAGCTTCSSNGYNCDCGQCASMGYTYYCPGDIECYSTELTCKINCPGSCQPTASCEAPNTCTAAQAKLCSSSETCCRSGVAPYNHFCASGAKATCCNYKEMSCPPGKSCNPTNSGTEKCLAPSPTPSAKCLDCEKFVKSMEADGGKKGCAYACGLFPTPYNLLCTALMAKGLCAWIEKELEGHMGASQICDMLGACSGNACPCGYCSPDYFGQWCLSTPNKCPPTTATKSAVPSMFAPLKKPPTTADKTKKGDENTAIWVKGLNWRVPRHIMDRAMADGDVPRVEEYCADGMCEAKHAGCCLTCAP